MAAVSDYSGLDRFLHRLAFSSPGVQRAAAEIEDSMFRRQLEGVETGAPIFITSLPRAGTTTLLAALAGMPDLATHTYRDMPFVMAPMLWARLSGGFRKDSHLKERAHGDGIAIGYDSPEAFEEVLWRTFWPGHYQDDGIDLWRAEEIDKEATAFFVAHFRKIVALRHPDIGGAGRYVSKNNGNIARLALLPVMFPEARILVPVRNPMAHAASLHRQHANFLTQHAEDPFVRRYMADIGHYEFGALHRPIRFPDFARHGEGLNPADLDYWLAYWTACFAHVEGQRDQLRLVDYDALCRGSAEVAQDLCAASGLDPAYSDAIGGHFRAPPELKPEIAAHRSPLREEAETLYHRLVG